ncbi:hypothetical protein Tco_0363026 [Tanacetum coccineum]
MEEDNKILIILGRPFLATAHATIDVFNKKISFEVGNKTITFDIEKSMKFSTPEDDTYKNDEFEHEELGLSSKKDSWEPNDFIKPTLFATSTSETEAQLPKLKELSSHLEYAFLNDNHEFSAKIVKLLDVGLIYAISDSPWVSPIHVVPRKGGMTIITNENNELVLTRTVIGWRTVKEMITTASRTGSLDTFQSL